MSVYSNHSLHEEDQKYYLPTFRRFPLALSHGKGSRVWDVEGNEYIDMLAGIAVNNVGHAHPRVVGAIREQAGQLLHVSNFFVTPQQVELSKRLTSLSGLDRVFLTNSGAESLEGAIKIARKYAHSRGRGGTVLSFENSFHGRTMATIATGQKKYQQGFEPIPSGFAQVAFNDTDSVNAAISDDVAAILIEPIQGEGGINVARKEFLENLRELCNENDIVLIFDEVQCGVGRTGKWFAKDHYGIQPDIMTLAKGLGGGAPIGAVLSNEKVSRAIDFGDHGTTFGGNPLACSAALATLSVIEEEELLDKACTDGEWLMEEVKSWEEPSVVEVRGAGLMIGIQFDFEAKPLVMEMLEHGIIANATAGNVLRLVPPLNIPKADLNRVLHVLKESLKSMKHHA